MDQQIYWSSLLLNSVESQNLPEFPLSPNDTTMSHANQIGEESAELSIWSSGGASSSEHPINQRNHESAKNGHNWASSLTIDGGQGSITEDRHLEANSMLLASGSEERQLEAANMLSLNVNVNLNSNQVDGSQSFSENSGANRFPHSFNHNAGHAIMNSQILESGQCSHSRNPGFLESVHVPSSDSPSIMRGSSSRAAGFLPEHGEVRAGGSLDGRHVSFKRKNIEGVPEQYSAGGSSSYFHQRENSLLCSVSSHHNANTSLTISNSSDYPSVTSAPEELLNPRTGSNMGVGHSDSHPFSIGGNGESSRRNFRIRIDPEQHQATAANQWTSGNTVRLSDTWSANQVASLSIPFNQPLEPRTVVPNGTSDGQPHVLTIPGLVQNTPPFPWNGGSSARAGSSLRSLALTGERLSNSREETNSRGMPRSSIPEHSAFAPTADARHMVHDPTNWSLSNGNTSMPGQVTPTLRPGTVIRARQSAATTWVPQQVPPTLYLRGTSEVQRPLYQPGSSEPGGQSVNLPTQRAGNSGTSQEVSHRSAAVSRGHQHPYLRSALVMDRRNDGVLGVPVAMRNLAAAREGRSRMISEQIRNALLMRRGENIRFEDVLIFDQSVFFGGAGDLHDRHRDMRLDVDNMSYEELLALEERIGNVSTGVSEEMVLKHLKQQKYFSLAMETSKEVEPCCICQEEYIDGEDLGALDCGHDFHTACIKQWLTMKNLCPICKTTGLVT